jgi:hypothetical protein
MSSFSFETAGYQDFPRKPCEISDFKVSGIVSQNLAKEICYSFFKIRKNVSTNFKIFFWNKTRQMSSISSETLGYHDLPQKQCVTLNF